MRFERKGTTSCTPAARSPRPSSTSAGGRARSAGRPPRWRPEGGRPVADAADDTVMSEEGVEEAAERLVVRHIPHGPAAPHEVGGGELAGIECGRLKGTTGEVVGAGIAQPATLRSLRRTDRALSTLRGSTGAHPPRGEAITISNPASAKA